jgi:hypothetical protein
MEFNGQQEVGQSRQQSWAFSINSLSAEGPFLSRFFFPTTRELFGVHCKFPDCRVSCWVISQCTFWKNVSFIVFVYSFRPLWGQNWNSTVMMSYLMGHYVLLCIELLMLFYHYWSDPTLILMYWSPIGNVLAGYMTDSWWSIHWVSNDCGLTWLVLMYWCCSIITNGIQHWFWCIDHLLEMYWLVMELIVGDQSSRFQMIITFHDAVMLFHHYWWDPTLILMYWSPIGSVLAGDGTDCQWSIL